MIVSLTGFMGCGKSSVGRRLSELLCCRFVDLDDAVVERAGRSIPEIFATDGEAAFRQMEREVLGNIVAAAGRQQENDKVILALGGGAVMQEECEKMVHEETVCIYLKASVETLLSHIESQAAGRPLLSAGSAVQNDLRERISDLMSRRSSTYERTAHLTIGTDGKSVEAIAEEILINLFPSTQGPE